jgi:inner membrane protein
VPASTRYDSPMEPVTHFLTGACIGRAGLNRTTAYCTLATVLAAEAPDIDVLWSLDGPIAGFKHHRGITHTFLGAPFMAAAVVGLVALVHIYAERRRRRVVARLDLPAGAPIPAQLQPKQIHWGWLYFAALLATLSHILLDWTNNYGVRPFFPFNPRWYAGSFVFIADPILWALLFAAVLIPWILGLADNEIGVRRTPFRGRSWAIFALCGMVLVGALRLSQQFQARALLENIQVTAQPAIRIALEPYPFNPFRWHAILETPSAFQTAEIDTRTGQIASDPATDAFFKPPITPAVEAAKKTELGRAYLDWSSWAVVRDLGPQPIPYLDAPQLPAGHTWTTVEFSDLRFAYSFMPNSSAVPRNPLGAEMYIVDGREEAGSSINGHTEH